MISPTTAAIALSVARGLIKLGHRLDVLLAEREAVTAGQFFLPTAVILDAPDATLMCQELTNFLPAATQNPNPDWAEDFLEDLQALLKADSPTQAALFGCYKIAFPEKAVLVSVNPDAEFLSRIKAAWPTLDLSDQDTLTALFHVAAGQDSRQVSYGLRVGLLVADSLAEFGAENAQLFVRDPGVRKVVESVLLRFAKPDLDTFTAWSPLLRHALSATLNGALDARASIIGDSRWLGGLLDALYQARTNAEDGDNYLIGLLRGRGYRPLISEGLSRAAKVLSEDNADPFRNIAAVILTQAATLVAKDEEGFGEFFRDHWGDLLQSGLKGLEKYGPSLLENQSPLLQTVLLSLIKQLAAQDRLHWFTAGTLTGLADAAISAVAAKPDVLSGRFKNKPWLKALIESFLGSIAKQGVRRALSEEGLEKIMTDAAQVFAEHPDLIIRNPGLLQDVVGNVLQAVSKLGSLDAKNIATATAQGALTAIASNPALLDTRYTKLVADFAGRLAELIEARTITGLDGAGIANAAVTTLLRNPILFDELEGNLARVVLDSVLKAAESSESKLLAGTTLVATVREVLTAVGRHGRDAATGSLEEFGQKLTQVLAHGLARAETELGRRLDLPALPTVLGELTTAWIVSDNEPLDLNSKAFKDLFNQLAAAAIA